MQGNIGRGTIHRLYRGHGFPNPCTCCMGCTKKPIIFDQKPNKELKPKILVPTRLVQSVCVADLQIGGTGSMPGVITTWSSGANRTTTHFPTKEAYTRLLRDTLGVWPIVLRSYHMY